MELKHIVLIDKNSRRTFKTTHAIVTMRHFCCKYEIYARTFAPVPFRDTNISIKITPLSSPLTEPFTVTNVHVNFNTTMELAALSRTRTACIRVQ